MANNTALVNYMKIILGTDVSDDIVSYISSIKQEDDYEEFMENILDRNNSAHIRSYEGIRDIIFKRKKGKNQQKNTSQNNVQNQVQQQRNNQKSNYQNLPSSQQRSQSPPFNQKISVTHVKKGKSKFKDISTYQEKKKQKEGRSACDCLGQEHEFMNNCMVCGRIHCMEEGPGPCLFCGNMITVAGTELFNVNKKSKAIMKPKLNKVFDDDNDYFKINSKKNSDKDSKQKMIIALDFATRRVIESTKEDAKIRERLLADSVEHLKKVDEIYKDIQRKSEQRESFQHSINQSMNEELINLLIQMRHKKPVGEEDLGPEDNIMPVINYNSFGNKVFDEELMMNADHGLCLSMHQPWASLLVAGVKKDEGRTWPTTHRGRLWIAAAAKVPEEEEIQALESFYRHYYQDTSLKFPKDYPTGCLLGCVNVDDCLEQDEYRQRYPNGESNSPFVLICSNPIILPIFYPIVGKHKIYPLDKELHKCAKIALKHAKYVL